MYIKEQAHERVSKSLSSKSINMNSDLFHMGSLIVKKYCEEKNGIQFCDLYSIMTAFNRKIVKRYSACKVDVIIDSADMVGMVIIKNRKEFLKSFEETIQEFKKLGSNYHLIVEEFHQDEVIVEYENVFHMHE